METSIFIVNSAKLNRWMLLPDSTDTWQSITWYLGVDANQCVGMMVEFFLQWDDNALKRLLRLLLDIAGHLANSNCTIYRSVHHQCNTARQSLHDDGFVALNRQQNTDRDGDTEKGCQKPTLQQKTTDDDDQGKAECHILFFGPIFHNGTAGLHSIRFITSLMSNGQWKFSNNRY